MAATLSRFFTDESMDYLIEKHPDIFFRNEEGKMFAKFDQVEVRFPRTLSVEVIMRNKGRPVSVHKYELTETCSDMTITLLDGSTLHVSRMWEDEVFEQRGEISVEIGVVG